MNFGTKIRTVLVIATCLNTALLAIDVAQFGNETVNLVYQILSVLANFVIVFCATWFNNDYTPEAAIGTGVTRQLKAEKADGYLGDMFYSEDVDDELLEDEEIADIVEEEVDESEVVPLDEEGEKVDE